MVSEILRFLLPRSAVKLNAFHKLRDQLKTCGLAKTQFFGYVLQNEGFPLPKLENHMCWYIEWSEDLKYRTSQEWRSELEQIAGANAKSILLNLKETKHGEVVKGLESKACQFAIINLNAKAQRFEPELEVSMDKTFTDCYFAKGFTGGGWAYVLNTNDAEGREADASEQQLEEKDQKLAYYLIGWDSLADHHAYAKTELFDIEIDKLMPYFGFGSGAFYVEFEKHD